MFAMNLAALLCKLASASDFSSEDRSDILDRFESLRGYGKLPRGRERKAQHLTTSEIATVILGLSTSRPKWAGHAAVVLSNLRAVGGKEAGFFGADTLREAVEIILTDHIARSCLIRVCVSGAESGLNSYGQALLVFDRDGIRRNVAYVPKEALSLLRSGADELFDWERRYSSVSRETSYSGRFFEQVSQAIELSSYRAIEHEFMLLGG